MSLQRGGGCVVEMATLEVDVEVEVEVETAAPVKGQ